jgi:hypothetical protein
MSLVQTPPGLPYQGDCQAGLACRGSRRGSPLPATVRHAERRCPHERHMPGPPLGHTPTMQAVGGGHHRYLARELASTTSSPGMQTVPVPRETRRAAGRLWMARTGFPPTPGSRHRGSVGGRPRYGGRAASPPAPSDSPSLGTHGGARRPAPFGGTSARLALAPCAPFLPVVPHRGDNHPTPIGNECHPAFYTQRASRRMPVRTGWTMTPGRGSTASSPARGARPSRSGCA